jgi:hypothetical protein
MENYTVWLIYFFTLIGYALIGVFIYSQKRLREKVNLKEVWQLFWIIIILRAFDVLSTIYFTNKIGIEYEGNLIARAFMFQFGNVIGILLISLLIIPIMFFWFVLLNYIFKDNKMGWKFFRALMITVSVIVPLINFFSV